MITPTDGQQKKKKTRAGIRWDNVADENWKDLGGAKEEELLSSQRSFGGYENGRKKVYWWKKGKMLELRNKVKEDKHLRDRRRFEGRCWNENVSARPNGLPEKAETATSCGGPGRTRKKKEIYQQSRVGGRGYKYVPVWHNNRDQDAHSRRM